MTRSLAAEPPVNKSLVRIFFWSEPIPKIFHFTVKKCGLSDRIGFVSDEIMPNY